MKRKINHFCPYCTELGTSILFSQCFENKFNENVVFTSMTNRRNPWLSSMRKYCHEKSNDKWEHCFTIRSWGKREVQSGTEGACTFQTYANFKSARMASVGRSITTVVAPCWQPFAHPPVQNCERSNRRTMMILMKTRPRKNAGGVEQDLEDVVMRRPEWRS